MYKSQEYTYIRSCLRALDHRQTAQRETRRGVIENDAALLSIIGAQMRLQPIDGFDTFEWDEDKRADNLRKHKIDFSDVIPALQWSHLAASTTKETSDPWHTPQDRWIALVELDSRTFAIIYVRKDDACRIISARRASRNERKAYHAYFGE